MRDGRCSACGATTVRAARNGVQLGGDRPDGVLRPHVEPGARGAFRPHTTDVWNYLCLTCGTLTFSVYAPDAFEFVRDQWIEVRPDA